MTKPVSRRSGKKVRRDYPQTPAVQTVQKQRVDGVKSQAWIPVVSFLLLIGAVVICLGPYLRGTLYMASTSQKSGKTDELKGRDDEVKPKHCKWGRKTTVIKDGTRRKV